MKRVIYFVGAIVLVSVSLVWFKSEIPRQESRDEIESSCPCGGNLYAQSSTRKEIKAQFEQNKKAIMRDQNEVKQLMYATLNYIKASNMKFRVELNEMMKYQISEITGAKPPKKIDDDARRKEQENQADAQKDLLRRKGIIDERDKLRRKETKPEEKKILPDKKEERKAISDKTVKPKPEPTPIPIPKPEPKPAPLPTPKPQPKPEP